MNNTGAGWPIIIIGVLVILLRKPIGAARCKLDGKLFGFKGKETVYQYLVLSGGVVFIVVGVMMLMGFNPLFNLFRGSR